MASWPDPLARRQRATAAGRRYDLCIHGPAVVVCLRARLLPSRASSGDWPPVATAWPGTRLHNVNAAAEPSAITGTPPCRPWPTDQTESSRWARCADNPVRYGMDDSGRATNTAAAHRGVPPSSTWHRRPRDFKLIHIVHCGRGAGARVVSPSSPFHSPDAGLRHSCLVITPYCYVLI